MLESVTDPDLLDEELGMLLGFLDCLGFGGSATEDVPDLPPESLIELPVADLDARSDRGRMLLEVSLGARR